MVIYQISIEEAEVRPRIHVAGILLFQGNNVLLVKELDGWSIPAGKREKSRAEDGRGWVFHEFAYYAALREFREEVRIELPSSAQFAFAMLIDEFYVLYVYTLPHNEIISKKRFANTRNGILCRSWIPSDNLMSNMAMRHDDTREIIRFARANLF